MTIKLIRIDDVNREDALKLHVGAAQTHMVESVEECLAEAAQLSLWRPAAISVDNEWVGFAMYGFWEEEGTAGRVWLDRFFIDYRYQGRGYAGSSLLVLSNHLFEEYDCNEIYLSVYKENRRAIKLYREFGFCFNGETDINGEKMMVLKRPIM